MSQTTDSWPLAERLRSPTPAPRRTVRRKPLPRAAWLLALTAFLCGLAISAAAFSMGWRNQAQLGSTAEAELTTKTARVQQLTASLADARATTKRLQTRLAAAASAKNAARASSLAVSRQASTLASSLVTAGRSADSVSLGATAVGNDVDKVASELKTLTSYLTSTPATQLDPGYISSQTTYLAKQLAALQASRSDLGSAIADFDTAAKKLADRAATLSGRN